MTATSLREQAESAADRGRPVGGVDGRTLLALLDVLDAAERVEPWHPHFTSLSHLGAVVVRAREALR